MLSPQGWNGDQRRANVKNRLIRAGMVLELCGSGSQELLGKLATSATPYWRERVGARTSIKQQPSLTSQASDLRSWWGPACVRLHAIATGNSPGFSSQSISHFLVSAHSELQD